MLMRKLNRMKYQYSLRRARPPKSAKLPSTAKYQFMKVPGIAESENATAAWLPRHQTMDLGSCGESSRDESPLQELCSPRPSRFQHPLDLRHGLRNHPPHPTTPHTASTSPRAPALTAGAHGTPASLHAGFSAYCTSCPLFCQRCTTTA